MKIAEENKVSKQTSKYRLPTVLTDRASSVIRKIISKTHIKKGGLAVPPKTNSHLNRTYAYANLKASLVSFSAFLVTMSFLLLNFYTAYAAGLSVGYRSGNGVVNGMIVAVSNTDANSIEPANVNNSEYVVGVAVDQESSALVLDNNDSVYVATEGAVPIFVSTVNGDIEQGDLVMVSAIDGVGQKRDELTDGHKVVGVAKGSFNKDSVGSQQRNFENSGEVYVGLVEVELLMGDPVAGRDSTDSASALVRIGKKLAGKPVSLGQVIITAAVVIIAFVVSGALLFGAIKGSFTSIGRNPLSAKTIYQGMLRAILVSLAVMMLGIVGGYVVLVL